MSKPTVLLDVDHTILDMTALKSAEGSVIEANYGLGSAKVFWEVYEKVRQERGVFNVEQVAMRFAETISSENYASAVSAFLEVDFNEFLFKGARELIDYLAENSNLVIFTHGDDIFQRQKVEKLGLDKVSKKVVITESKKNALPAILAEFNEPYFLIDDNAEVIAAVKGQNVPVTTILMTIDSHHNEGASVKPDFAAGDLFEVLDYLKRKFE